MYDLFFKLYKITTAKRDVLKDEQTIKKSIKRYTLDKLTYSDSKKELNDTELIKTGDEFTINGGSKNTRYKIVCKDSSTDDEKCSEKASLIKKSEDLSNNKYWDIVRKDC